MVSQVTNEELKGIRNKLLKTHTKVRAWMIKDEVKTQYKYDIDESTVRGRFIEMGEPLSGGHVGSGKEAPQEEKIVSTIRAHINDTLKKKNFDIPDELKAYIPHANEFTNYVERDVDRRLAIHYNTGKYPITQGKQGTGKTFSHMFYAYSYSLPFFLFNGHKDFKLRKYFGDKTIKEGTIRFQESMFVKALQNPSVILFDEINNIEETIDYHALLQNRQLYIKDANDGKGKTFHLHPECRMGFAQNPKSTKYIGGKILPSNFLGRCTYISYPEFKKSEIKNAISKRFITLQQIDVDKFTAYYFAVIDMIERSSLPVDISIRQLNSVIDLWMAGLPIKDAIEDGLSSIVDSISQPKAKDSFFRVAQAIWKEMM